MLTAEIMDQEALVVAEGIDRIIRTGMKIGGDVSAEIMQLVGQGLATWGDVQAGLDDDANEERFTTLVLGNLTLLSARRLMSLTKTPE